MNVIFLFVIVLSGITLILTNPSAFLPALFSGATESLKLAFSLAAVYILWLGIFGVAENTGVTGKLAKLLKKPVRLLFGEVGDAEKDIAINLSANLLGLGGIATPHGISAIKKLDAHNNALNGDLDALMGLTVNEMLNVSGNGYDDDPDGFYDFICEYTYSGNDGYTYYI